MSVYWLKSKCTRKRKRTNSSILTRPTAAVISYVKQTTPLSNSMHQQLSFLIQRRANLTLDTMHSSTYQLNSTSSRDSDDSWLNPIFSLKLSESMCNLADNPCHSLSQLETVKLKQILDAKFKLQLLSPQSFSMGQGANSLSYVDLFQTCNVKTALLGKRRSGKLRRSECIHKLKQEHLCRACGDFWHWS